jgi:hypothetical protein
VLGKPVRRSPIQGDPAVLVVDEWINPGDRKRLWVYVSGKLDHEGAIATARRMVSANELEWVRLHGLVFEKCGKGADAVRWAVDVLVRLPDAPEQETHVFPLPESML